MAIPFCEPAYNRGGVRRRQSQVSTGLSLRQLSLSSRVLLCGLLETWRILFYVTRGEEEVANSDDEEDLTSLLSDDAKSDSDHGFEYIVNSVSISQPDNAVVATKEDEWSHTATSTCKSSNPDVAKTVCCKPDLLSTHNIVAGQLDSTSPQQSHVMTRQQPSPNPPLRQSNACLPDLLTHLPRPANTQDPLTPTTHHNCPPNEDGLPDLLLDHIHHNITSIPHLIPMGLPPPNSSLDLFLITSNRGRTSPPGVRPSTIRNKRGGEYSRKHDRRKPHPGLNHSGNQGSGEPQDFVKCDTIARENMITHDQTKAASGDKRENWRQIGRSLRRIAHILELGEGSRRMGVRIRREEIRRHSLGRCEGISQDVRPRHSENLSQDCENTRLISDLLIALGLLGLFALVKKVKS